MSAANEVDDPRDIAQPESSGGGGAATQVFEGTSHTKPFAHSDDDAHWLRHAPNAGSHR